jgi:hypothetical protein
MEVYASRYTLEQRWTASKPRSVISRSLPRPSPIMYSTIAQAQINKLKDRNRQILRYIIARE